MPHIGTRPLAQLLRRVGTSLKAGLDMRTIWERESRQGSPLQREQLAEVSRRIAAGDSCAEALAACQGYFPSLACDLVEAGERAGRLEDVLFLLADHYEHLLNLRRTFLFGIAWPAIQLAAAIAIVGLLIWITGIIGGMSPGGKPIDVLGVGLVGTWGLIKYLFLVGAVSGTITFGVVALMRGAFGPWPLQLAMQLPVIGGCLRAFALSRFAGTLAMTLDAGVDALRALQLSLRSTQNAYFTAHREVAEQKICAGREFHEALRATGVFPADFLHALETAELTGTPGETLERLAKDYRQRAQTAARALAVAASVGIWVLVAGLLILLIFRIFLVGYLGPILELEKELKVR